MKNSNNQLVKFAHTSYFFCAIYVAYIVTADSGNLIPRDIIIQRWSGLTALILVTTIVWYVLHETKSKKKHVYAIIALALMQLILAGLTTYWERGMASTSTLMYALPLITIASLNAPRLLTASAIAASATYALAIVVYFNAFFNEGFRIQLWSQMLLTIGLIFVARYALTANMQRK